MNQIYKVIWSKVKGSYIVTSEIAKNHGKSKSSRGLGQSGLSRSALAVAVCLALGSFALPVGQVEARVEIGQTQTGQYGNYSVQKGSAAASNETDIAIGANAKVTSTAGYTNGSVALGTAATATGNQALAIGSASRALADQTTVIGNDGIASDLGAIVIGGDDTKSLYHLITGNEYGFIRDNRGLTGVSGDYDQSGGFKYRASVAGGIGAVTVGSASQAISQGSTAIGVMATAGDGGKIVSGTYKNGLVDVTGLQAQSTQNIEATAIGAYSHAQSEHSTAIGYKTSALGNDATAIGSGAIATDIRDLAIGTNVRAEGNDNGSNTETPAIAIGYDTTVIGDDSIAIGAHNKVFSLDKNNKFVSGANIIGHNNKVEASGAGILGNNNIVAPGSEDAFILGDAVTKTTSNSVFLGNGSGFIADAANNDSPSKGTNKYYTDQTINGKTYNFAGGAQTVGVVSVGGYDDKYKTYITRRIQGVAPGFIAANSTDAVNGSQLFAVADTLSRAASHYYSVNTLNSTDGNYNNDGAAGTDSMAAGKGTRAIGAKSTAVGTNAITYGNNSTALGQGTQTGVQYPAGGQENATGATAIGSDSKAYARESIAIGSHTAAGNEYNPSGGFKSIAMGTNARTTADYSIAVGSGKDKPTVAESTSAVVIGDGAQTTNSTGANNIVIGTGAFSSAGADNIVMGAGALNAGNDGGSLVLGKSASVASGAKADSIAIGTSSKVEGGGVAIGVDAHINASSATHGGSIAIGDHSEVASAGGGIAIGEKARSINSTGANGGAIALGEEAVSNGNQSIAMGYQAGNKAAQEGQIALGANAKTFGEHAIAIGMGAKTEDNNSGQLALGYNATVKYGGGIALGSNSVADRSKDVQAAYDPYIPAGASANQKNAITATKATTSALSIGDSTNKVYRQITNVAAGGADTDAVNVAQLKAATADSAQNFIVGADSQGTAPGVNITKTNQRFDIVGQNGVETGVNANSIQVGLDTATQTKLNQIATNTANITKNTGDITKNTNAISTINTTIAKGTKYGGDTGTAFTRQLGEQANVKGGVTSAADLTTGNIGVVSDGTDTLNVRLAKELTGLTSVTTGSAKMDTNGVTITNVDTNKTVSLTGKGLNTGDNKITNLKSGLSGESAANGDTATVTTATGKTLTNAANIGDVQGAVNALSWNAQNNGQAVDKAVIKNGGIVNFANGTATVATVTADTAGTKVVYDLNDTAKNSLTKANSALQNFTTSVDSNKAQTVDAAHSNANFITGTNMVLKPSADGITIATKENVTFTKVVSDSIVIGKQNNQTELKTISSTGADGAPINALSVGGNKITNVGAGVDASDAVNMSQLEAAKIHYYSVNNINKNDNNYNNDGALGKNSLAAGVNALAGGANSTAVGNGANTTAENAVALGNNSKVNHKSGVAIGDEATVNGEHSIAIGTDAVTDMENGIAIGQGAHVKTTSSIALGRDSIAEAPVGTTSYTIGGKTRNFSGTSPVGSVSVGNETAQRTITNVGAGRISANSTDAVNGSQLYQTIEAVNGNTDAITNLQKGWKLATGKAANSTGSASAAVPAAITADETVTLEAGNNIALTQAENKVTIATSMTPTFTSVTVPNTSGNANTSAIVIDGNGINAGGKTITNVAKGVNDNDAVNKKQLIDTIAERIPKFADGKNTKLTVKAVDGIEYRQVDLKDDITLGDTSTTAGQKTAVHIDGTNGLLTVGNTITADGKTGNLQAGGITLTNGTGATGVVATVNGLTNRTWDIKNPTPVNGQAATEDQLKVVSDGVNTNSTAITDINTTIDKGLSFKGDNAVINKKLGQQLDITGGATSGLTAGNIGVISNGTGLSVKLKEDLDLGTNGSLVIGSTTVDKAGINITGATPNSNVSLTNKGLNNGNQTITNVASGGTVDSNAANIGDVKKAVSETSWTAANNAGNAINDVKNDSIVKFADGDGTVSSVTKDASGNLTSISYDLSQAVKTELGKATTALQSLTTAVDGTKAQTLNQNQTQANFKTGKNIKLTGADDGITIATTDTLSADSITIGKGTTTTTLKTTADGGQSSLDIGGNRITNLADGVKNSDAVNKGQLDQAIAGNQYSWTVSDGTDSKAVAKAGTVNVVGSANGKADTDSGIVTKLSDTGDTLNVDLSAKTKTDIQKGVDAKTTLDTQGLTFKAKDDSTTNVEKLGSTVTITGDANVTTRANADTLTVGLNSNLTGISSISSADGTTISLGKAADGGKTVDLGGAQITNVKSGGTKETNAANIGDVNKAKTDLTNTGMQFTGNDGQAVARKLGETLSIKGDLADVTSDVSGANIGVKKNTAGDGLDIVMSEKPNFKEVTAGTDSAKKVTISDDGVKVGDKTYLTNAGINANDQTITDVADGSLAPDSKEAVNGGQLYKVDQKVIKNTNDITKQGTRITNLEGGFKVTANGDTAKQSTIKAGDTLNLDSGENTLVTTTADSKSITIAMSKTPTLESVTITNTSSANGAGNVVINGDGINAGNKTITNVAPGAVTADSKEAVNGGQLFETNQNVKDLKEGWNVVGGADGGTQTNGAKTVVKAKDTVAINAGKNLALNQKTVPGQTDLTLSLQDKVTLGEAGNAISIDGISGKISINNNLAGGQTNLVIDGSEGNIYLGGSEANANIQLHGKESSATFGNIDISNNNGTSEIKGLTNKTLNVTNFAGAGRAATEEQLQAAMQKMTGTITTSATRMDKTENTSVSGDGTTASPFKVSINQDLVNMHSAVYTTNGDERTITNGLGIYATTADNIDENAHTVKDISKAVSLTTSGVNAGSKVIINVASDIDNKSGNNFKEKLDNAAAVNPASGVNVTDLKGLSDNVSLRGLDFVGNDGNANKVHRDLGTTLSIQGGLDEATVTDTNKVSSKNLGVKKNAAGDGLDILMSETPSFTSVEAKDAAGNTSVITGSGVTITPKVADPGKTPVSLTAAGLTNGGNRITGVATGTDDTDAVNVKQLREEISSQAPRVNSGKNTSIVTRPDKSIQVDVNDTIVLGDADTAEGLKKAIAIDGNTGKIAIGNLTNVVKDPVSGKVLSADGGTIIADGTTGSLQAGGITLTNTGLGTPTAASTINGLTNRTWDVKNPSPVNGQAATEDQLKVVSDAAKKNADALDSGLKFKGDSAGVLTKKMGQQLDIKGGAASDLTLGNIGVIEGNGALNVRLKKDLDLGTDGSVTMGDTTISNAGLMINSKTYVSKTGINANGSPITNLASGGDVGGNAANINDVNRIVDKAAWTVQDNAGTNVNTVKNGSKVKFANGTATVATVTQNDAVNTTVMYDLNTDSKNSLAKADTALQGITTAANGTKAQTLKGTDTQANFKSGKNIKVSGDNTGITIATANDVSFNTLETTSMKLGSGDSVTNLTTTKSEGKNALDVGGNKITNLADGSADNDAVTMKQLKNQIAAGSYNWNISDGQITQDVPDNTSVSIKGSANGQSSIQGGIVTSLGAGNVLGVDLSDKTKEDIQKGTDANTKVTTDGLRFTGDAGTTDKILLGNTLTIQGDTNVETHADNQVVTLALHPKLVNIQSITNGGTTIQLNKPDALGNKTISMEGAQITNLKSGLNGKVVFEVKEGDTEYTNAATIGDLANAVEDAAALVDLDATKNGLNFVGNDGDANKVHRDLGQTLSIKGELADITSDVSGANIGVKKNTAGDGLDIVMSEKPNFKEVTAGTDPLKQVTISDDGVKVGDKTYLTNAGINANDQTITNVADGSLAPDSKEAVNGGQLYKVDQKVIKNTNDITNQGNRITNLEGGFKVTANGDTAKQSTIKAGDTLNLDSGENTLVTTTADSKSITIAMSKTPTLESVTITNTSSANGAGNVVINGDGINAGNKTITNVAPGAVTADSKEAVNGGQLFETNRKVDANTGAIQQNTGDITTNAINITNLQKTWSLLAAADGGTVSGDVLTKIDSGDTVTMKAGKNIDIKQDGKSLTLATVAEPNFDKVTVGQAGGSQISLSDTDGVKIGTTTYVSSKGLNAGGKKITNVADGEDPEDAVNKSQLDSVKTHYMSVNSDVTGDLSNYDNNGAKVGGVAVGPKAGAGTKAVGIGYDAYAKDNAVAIGKEALANANESIAIGDKSLIGGKSTNSIAIGNNAQALRKDSIALGSEAIAETVEKTERIQVNGVSHNVAGTEPVGTLSIGTAGKERTITNLAAGRVSETSTDAVNGSQLFAVTSELDKGLIFSDGQTSKTNKLGSQVTIQGEGLKDIDKYTGTNLKTRISQKADGNTTIDVLMDKNAIFDSVTAGDDHAKQVTISNDGLKVGGKTYVTGDGLNAQSQKITNVANGRIEKDSKDAVNGGQLLNVIDGISDSATGGFGFTDDSGDTTKKVQQDLGHQIQLKGADGITVTGDGVHKTMTFGLSNEVKVGTKEITAPDGSTIPGKDGTVTVEGADGSTVKLNGKDGSIGLAGKDGKDGLTIKGAPGVVGVDGKDGLTRMVYETVEANPGGTSTTVTHTIATMDDGMKYAGDDGQGGTDKVISKKMNQTLDIIGGADSTKLTDDNIGVNNVSGQLKVQLAKDLKKLTGVETVVTDTAGNVVNSTMTTGSGTKVTNRDGDVANLTVEGLTLTKKGDGTAANPDKRVSLTAAGLDNGGNKITNVADGAIIDGSKEAVNGGQLFTLQQTLDGGLGFAGDVGQNGTANKGFKRKLGQKTNIIGGISDVSQLSDNNIGVVSNGSDTLTVKLGKDLRGIDSITMAERNTSAGIDPITGVRPVKAKITLTGQGLRIIPEVALNSDGSEKTDAASKRKIVTINADGNNSINAGELYITNVKSSIENQAVGTSGTFKEKLDKTAADEKLKNNAVNVTDLQNFASAMSTAEGKGVYGLKDEGGSDYKANLGETVQIVGDNSLNTQLVTVMGANGQPEKDANGNNRKQLEISLNNQVTVGAKVGKDGTAENGQVSVVAKNGKPGVTFTAAAEPGDNGADGRIILDGKADTGYTSVTIRTEKGLGTTPKTIDGSEMSRIIYQGRYGKDYTLATLENDGMKYGGDAEANGVQDKVIKKHLNEQVNVIGGISDADQLSSGDNLGVISDGTNNLTIRLAKDLKGLSTVTTEDETGHTNIMDGSGNIMTDGIGNINIITAAESIMTNKDQNLATIMDAGGIKIASTTTGSPKTISLTEKGLNNGGNQITHVESGLKDAVDDQGHPATIGTATGDTLYNAANIGDVQNAIKTANAAMTDTLTDKGLQFGADSGGSVTNKLGSRVDIVGSAAQAGHTYSSDNLTTEVKQDAAGKTTISLKMDKDLALDSVTTKDNDGNQSKMDGSGLTAKDKDGNQTKVDGKGLTLNGKDNLNPDGTVKDPNKSVSVTDKGLHNGGNQITNVKSGLDGATGNDGKAATIRTATGDTLTNVANIGDVQSAITGITAEVANELSDKGLQFGANSGGSVTNKLGSRVDITGGGTKEDSAYTDSNVKTKVQQKDGVTTVQVMLDKNASFESVTAKDADGNQSKVDGKGLTINGKDNLNPDGSAKDPNKSVSVTDKGLNNGGNQITNVSSGIDGRTYTEAGYNNGASIGDVRKITEEVAKTVQAGVKVKGDDKNIKVTSATGKLGGIEYTVSMADDLKAKTVTVGTDKAGTTLKTVESKGADGKSVHALDIGGNQITNIAAGKVEKGSTDAINGDQLYARDAAIVNNANAITNIADNVNKLGHRVNESGALSAALAGLKPIQYDPMEPTQIMAGVGHYHGENAVAIGVAHYKNESTMFHIGASLSSGEKMYNAGVTWKVGSHDKEREVPERYKAGPISSSYVMQDEISAMKLQNTKLVEENQAQKNRIDEQQTEIEKMKAQLAMLMEKMGVSS